MKPSLQLKLSQHLTLTPQLQQSIKLLQLSTIELNQEIERVLLENPMLEREDGDGGEYAPARRQAARPEREAAPEPAAEPGGRIDRARRRRRQQRRRRHRLVQCGPGRLQSQRGRRRRRLPGHPGRRRIPARAPRPADRTVAPVRSRPRAGALPDRGARRRRLPAPAAGRAPRTAAAGRRGRARRARHRPAPRAEPRARRDRRAQPAGVPRPAAAGAARERHPPARARDRHQPPRAARRAQLRPHPQAHRLRRRGACARPRR